MDAKSIVGRVLEEQPGKFLCISTKDRESGKWTDRFFREIGEAQKYLDESSEKKLDVYWCITKLQKKRRLKEHVRTSKFLWADLDEANPEQISPYPTIAWETSPKRFQALWELDQTASAEKVEELNKKLAYLVGADRSGWDLTQVLRIPGTVNYKYGRGKRGKLLWDDGPTYTRESIEEKLSRSTKSRIELLKKYRKRIPSKVWNLLIQRYPPEVGKRSELLWFIEHELAKVGCTSNEVYTIVKDSVWNKFAGRADEEERLRHEIEEAFKDETPSREDEERYDPEFSLTVEELESDDLFMSTSSLHQKWLVEHFWMHGSHGMVAGEPKSFKSTIVLDMAVSVASGKSFLGKYSVHDPGPVVVIQNENSRSIMRDRLIKIRSSKKLLGKAHYNRSRETITLTQPPRLPIYYLNQQGFSLSDPQHLELLGTVIEEVQPKLLILDPLYLMFAGDLSSSKDLNPVLSSLLSLRNSWKGLSILVIHHWNKNVNGSRRGGQRMLGSTTLHGWTESAWYIQVPSDQPRNIEPGMDPDVDDEQTSSRVVLEREFRGAGIYSKINLDIDMGKVGDSGYAVSVSKASEEERRGGRKTEMTEIDAEGAILDRLEGAVGPISLRMVAETINGSKRYASRLLNRLEAQGRVVKTEKGWSIQGD